MTSNWLFAGSIDLRDYNATVIVQYDFLTYSYTGGVLSESWPYASIVSIVGLKSIGVISDPMNEISTVTSTRGNGYKLYKSRCTHDIHRPKTFLPKE